MTIVTEDEFKAIKRHLKSVGKNTNGYFITNIAGVMHRSEAVIRRIDGSQNYSDYKKLVKSEHTAKKPRVPLQVQLHNARIKELVAIRAKGRFGAFKAACQRLDELSI